LQQSKPKSTRWRSYDLRGPLPLKTTRALKAAIQSLPDNVSGPEIDEEAWWRDVLSDARVRVPTRKLLPFDGWHSIRARSPAMFFDCICLQLLPTASHRFSR
jgi:hypothetical protein